MLKYKFHEKPPTGNRVVPCGQTDTNTHTHTHTHTRKHAHTDQTRQTDRQTDGHDEASSRFSQFFGLAKNRRCFREIGSVY